MHCTKRVVILTVVFLTRIATFDMVLWDHTRIVPCDNQLWQYSAHGVPTGIIVYATKAGKFT